MSEYQRFTAESAALFANQHSELFGEHSQLSCEILSEGAFNRVFRVQNQHGTSVIVKQALPIAHCGTESWPLTLDRARIEAEVLQIHRKITPDYVVDVRYYDTEQAAILMEDLGDMRLLRDAMLSGKQFDKVAEHIATYLAHNAFYSSDFVLDAPFKKARCAKFLNPELCLIHENLLFTDPYANHERNAFDMSLRPLAAELWYDEALKAEVAELKAKFESSSQALLHGDLHTGSIFATKDATKVTDAEFGFYGPMGFDLGCFIGHFMLNYCALPGLMTDPDRLAAQRSYVLEQINRTVLHFKSQLLALMARQTTDIALQSELFQYRYVEQVLQDAYGYAGIELIRRVIGLDHVDDFAQIQDKKLKNNCEMNAVQLGRKLLLQHRQLSGIQTVLGYLQELAD